MNKKYTLLTLLAVLIITGLVSFLWLTGISKAGLAESDDEPSERQVIHSSADIEDIEVYNMLHTMSGEPEGIVNDGASKRAADISNDDDEDFEDKHYEQVNEVIDYETVEGINEENTDDQMQEDDLAEVVDIIFSDNPPVLRNIEQEKGISIFVRPSETIKVDPELAEKLRKDAETTKQPLTGLFRTTLDILPNDEELKLDFSIENISGEDQEYYSGSSQKYDYFVCDNQGKEIYRWSDKMCFATVITETLHKKGETISFSQTWDYKDNAGSRAPSGEYSVTVRIIARRDDGRLIDQDELTAKEYFIVE